MKVRHYGRMAVLSMACMLLLAPGFARAEHTKLFCLVSSGTLQFGHLKERCFWRLSPGQYEASLGRGRFGLGSASKR
jgi:hypothetical protein